MIENRTYGFDGVNPIQITVDDINDDRMKDYVFVGGMQSNVIYVWTLTQTCDFRSLMFSEEVEGMECTPKMRQPVKPRFKLGPEDLWECLDGCSHLSTSALLSMS